MTTFGIARPLRLSVSGTVSASGDVGVSDLPSWATSAVSGRWSEVPATNTLDDLDITADPAITPSGADWVGAGFALGGHAWTGYVWDESALTWYGLMFGGHHDYGGNEPCKMVMTNAPTWERIRLPSGALPGPALTAQDGNEGDGTGCYSDGRLRAHHSYHNHIFVPGVGAVICRLTGAYYDPSASDTRRVWTINTSTGEKTERCNYHAFTQMGNGEGSVTYDEDADCLWTIGSATSTLVQITDLASATWTATKRGTWDNWLKASGCMRYVPGSGKLVLFPGYSGAGLTVIDTTTYAATHPTLSGSFSAGYVAPDGAVQQPGSGMEWCASLGCFLLWNNTSSTTQISTLTPSNASDLTQPWVRGTLTVDGGNTVTPGTSIASGTFGRMTYSARMAGVLLHPQMSGPTYFFKL